MIASALNGTLPSLQARPTALAKPGSQLEVGQVAAKGFPALIQMLLRGGDEGGNEFDVPPDMPRANNAGIVNPLTPQPALPAVVLLPLHLGLPLGNPERDKRLAEEPNTAHADALNPAAAAVFVPVSAPMPTAPAAPVQTAAALPKTNVSLRPSLEPIPEQASAPRVPSAAPPSEMLSKFDLTFEAKVRPSAKTEADGMESIKGVAPPAPLTTNTATGTTLDSGFGGQRNSEADTRENAAVQKTALKPSVAIVDVPVAPEREHAPEETSYPVVRETQLNRVPQQQHPESAPAPVASSATIDSPEHSSPVCDLSIRLTSSTNEQVDVKIQEKAGELRIAVHSSSPELSADLRQQVGELVSKLDRAGFQMDIVKSADHTISRQPASPGGDGQGGDRQGGAGQGREFSGRQQQDQQQAFSRPRKARQGQWMQENFNSLNSTAVEGVQNQ